MSWSTFAIQDPNDQVDLPEPVFGNDVEAEQRVQFEAAMLAARILASAVGTDDDQIMITLSGHANPDHKPREGWSNELIVVSVSVRN